MKRLVIHNERVYRVIPSPDLKTLFSLGAGGIVNKSCLETCRVIQSFNDFYRDDHDRAMEINFPTDTIFGIKSGLKEVKSLRVHSNRVKLFKGKPHRYICCVIFIKELGYIVSGHSSFVQVLTMKSCKKRRVITFGNNTKRVKSIVYSNKLKILVFVYNMKLVFCNSEKNFEKIKKIKILGSHRTMRFYKGSQWLICAGGNQILSEVKMPTNDEIEI